MTMQALSPQFGKAGSGLTDGSLRKVLVELQGRSFNLLTGVAAATKINVTGLLPEDTISAAIQFIGAGTSVTDLADLTPTCTIVDLRATGTLTLGAVVDGNTVVIRGKTYTFRTTPSNVAPTNEVALGASPTIAAANLVKKIKTVDGTLLAASSVAAVVTIFASAPGTAGNAYALVGSANAVASAATLAGGSAQGGVIFTGATTGSKILLAWVNKQ